MLKFTKRQFDVNFTLGLTGETVPLAVDEYHATIAALIMAAGLILFQLIVADISAIRAKHKAGTPIPPDFTRFYFRAARAHANTNESAAAFIALAVAGVLVSASPAWLNALSWLYIACRLAHMLSYYGNKKLARSSAFGLSLVALLGMLIICTLAVVSQRL